MHGGIQTKYEDVVKRIKGNGLEKEQKEQKEIAAR
jgi:hypothetical protein